MKLGHHLLVHAWKNCICPHRKYDVDLSFALELIRQLCRGVICLLRVSEPNVAVEQTEPGNRQMHEQMRNEMRQLEDKLEQERRTLHDKCKQDMRAMEDRHHSDKEALREKYMGSKK